MSSLEYNQFMADYILSCINAGKNSVSDICSGAETESQQIERQIKEIEQLRARQNKLDNIVRQLKGYSVKDRSVKTSSLIDISNSKDLAPNISDLCIKICQYIEDNRTATPRDLMENVSSVDENFAVYSSIKLLADGGIIKRSGIERAIVPGDNWKNRPGQYEPNRA